MKDGIKLSIVIAMYNEEENVKNTLTKVIAVADSLKVPYEIVAINDGSKDKTLELVKAFAAKNDKIVVCNHPVNQGLGAGLKTGFAVARGDIIIPMDADLSYEADYIRKLYEEIDSDPTIDVVTLSPYMKGGQTKGVPFIRLLVSKIGNRFIAFSMSTKIRTVSCMVRAYKKRVLDALDLDSQGAEIQVEILSKAASLGYKIKEIPAVLKGRVAGRTSFKYASGIIKHIIMSLYEKPMMVFGFFGIITLLLGVILGIYVSYLALTGNLGQGRAIVTLDAIMILAGFVMFFFGFVSNQLVILRREIYKVQRENKLLEKKFK